MKFINPNYTLVDEINNIFTIRQTEYQNIMPIVTQILDPVKDIGFEIAELDLKDSRFVSSDLSKTIKQNLIMKLKKGTSNIDLSISIPKLIDNNYFLINGKRKIPLFQLFDIPLITRGDSIKLRTNIATFVILVEKEEPRINITFLGKKVPLSLMFLAYYGVDELFNKYNLHQFQVTDPNNNLELLFKEIKDYANESKGYIQDDYINEVGRIYSKYNSLMKGYDIIYALDLIPKIDPISMKFFHTNSILDELVYALQQSIIDDTLFTNKRIRCFEYIVLAKISKIVFDFCMANRTAKQPKFNINSNQIISECNISDIVQFDFSINPIEELTKLTRTSLLGPGGFKRQNIPRHLRDIVPSMLGRLCTVDTPDRDNCGVLQSLIPNVKLDDNLKFTNEAIENQPISIPVALVPFIKNDDVTRLQMASSQMRQAIHLREFDKPMIASGNESLFTKHTQFVKFAKKDGEVLFKNANYLIVIYHDKEVEIFDISHRKIYVEHMDLMNVYVNTGDKFKAGEILAESDYCKNGMLTLGKNLLTGVMIYYGYNYEDGIVISNRLENEDVLTSVHFKDLSFTVPASKVLLTLDESKYKPIPSNYDRLNIGDPYAIMKNISLEDPYTVFSEEIKLVTDKQIIIDDIKIYANEWNTDIPEWNKWVQDTIQHQQEKDASVIKVLKDNMDANIATRVIKEKQLELSQNTGKYKNKKEQIDGILIEMYGVYQRKIKVGDKLANRHGNKGVISKIQPHEKMPKLEDGRHLDICINPLGLISRMNLGQLFELHLSMSLYDLKQNLLKMLHDNVDQEMIKKYLFDYIDLIDKTSTKWYIQQFKDQTPDVINEKFINDLILIQPPFESCKYDDIKKALEYTGTLFEQTVFDPIANDNIKNPIAVGYMYFQRMVHIAEEKLAARGIGAYAKRTLQPLGGRKNKGGQRCGEMETACIIGHDAPINLHEFFTTKSDCIDKKNNYIRSFIEPKLVDKNKEMNSIPESVKLLNAYLTVLGIDNKNKE